jgi:hypothetical protein
MRTFFSRISHKLNSAVEFDARVDKYSENFQDIRHATSCQSQIIVTFASIQMFAYHDTYHHRRRQEQ